MEALEDAFRKVTRPEGATLEQRNRAVHRMLADGVPVEYRRPDGCIAGAQARVLDFDDPDNNDWLAVNQFTVSENKHTRRRDVVLFVNGLPLGIIELKNQADEQATIRIAYRQLQTYKQLVAHLKEDGQQKPWPETGRLTMIPGAPQTLANNRALSRSSSASQPTASTCVIPGLAVGTPLGPSPSPSPSRGA